MTPDEIRRSWDDDDTPRSVFPEPLAERLTRENKELRADKAEFERWRDQWIIDMESTVASCARAEDEAMAAEARLEALVADLRGLAGDWNRLMGWPRNVGAPALAFVLDKHAGEQP